MASAKWPRLTDTGWRSPSAELDLALAGRGRANWLEPERLPVSHTGDQSRGAEERPAAERPPFQPGDRSCADKYVPEPPRCACRLHAPSSCVPYISTAQGSLPRAGSTDARPTLTGTGRAVRTACRTVPPQAIRELNISQCELEIIPEQISLLTSLLTLNASQNRHAPQPNPNPNPIPSPDPDPDPSPSPSPRPRLHSGSRSCRPVLGSARCSPASTATTIRLPRCCQR